MHGTLDYDQWRLRHDEELKATAEARLGRRIQEDRAARNASRLSLTSRHFAGDNLRRHAT